MTIAVKNKGGRPRLPYYSELTAARSKEEGGNASHKANLRELKRRWGDKAKVS